MAIELIEEKLDYFKEIVETQIAFNPAVADSTLDDIKVLLTKCQYLSQNSSSLPIYDRLLFREILELAVILGIRLNSKERIHDIFQQLRFFYFSKSRSNDLKIIFFTKNISKRTVTATALFFLKMPVIHN